MTSKSIRKKRKNCLLQGESCYRHPLLRGDGLCFPESHLQPCLSTNSTSEGAPSPNNCSSPGLDACCGHWCCPQNYFRFPLNANIQVESIHNRQVDCLSVSYPQFDVCVGNALRLDAPFCRQWKEKQCFSHSECRTWSTGKFCCDGTCCHQLPEEEYGEYQVQLLGDL